MEGRSPEEHVLELKLRLEALERRLETSIDVDTLPALFGDYITFGPNGRKLILALAAIPGAGIAASEVIGELSVLMECALRRALGEKREDRVYARLKTLGSISARLFLVDSKVAIVIAINDEEACIISARVETADGTVAAWDGAWSLGPKTLDDELSGRVRRVVSAIRASNRGLDDLGEMPKYVPPEPAEVLPTAPAERLRAYLFGAPTYIEPDPRSPTPSDGAETERYARKAPDGVGGSRRDPGGLRSVPEGARGSQTEPERARGSRRESEGAEGGRRAVCAQSSVSARRKRGGLGADVKKPEEVLRVAREAQP